MGSRAVVIVCRDEAAARRRFGVAGEGIGICYTRTGRRFFDDRDLETEFLDRVRAAADRIDLWTELDTEWLCLDCELMPWSAKAQELLRQQYAAVGSAARASLRHQESLRSPIRRNARSAAMSRTINADATTGGKGSKASAPPPLLPAHHAERRAPSVSADCDAAKVYELI